MPSQQDPLHQTSAAPSVQSEPPLSALSSRWGPRIKVAAAKTVSSCNSTNQQSGEIHSLSRSQVSSISSSTGLPETPAVETNAIPSPVRNPPLSIATGRVTSTNREQPSPLQDWRNGHVNTNRQQPISDDGRRSPRVTQIRSNLASDPRKRPSPLPSAPASTTALASFETEALAQPTTQSIGATKAAEGPAVAPEKFSSSFHLIDEVQWGPREEDDGYDSDQTLAPRPKNRITADVCNCHDPKEGKLCRDYSCINYACREECLKNYCVEHCGNQRLGRGEFKKVEVFDAGPKGYGLRVLADCVKGDIIQEYTGQAVRAEALYKLFRRYQHERRLYIMALDERTYLDARKAGGLARFINHSCNPNCKVEKWRVKGVYRAAVEAIKDIPAGTELTFDYQWDRKVGRAPTKCHCGEPCCRGTLESSKSLEDVQNEQLLSGKWVPLRHRKADERIVNRTIRIKNREKSADGVVCVAAEITDYNPDTKLHSILYPNLEEKWEDLNGGLSWDILDEENSPSKGNAIARKATVNHSSATIRKILPDTKNGSGGGGGGGGGLLTSFSPTDPVLSQHLFYLYIQTPIKEIMVSEESKWKERIGRNYQVKVRLEEQTPPPFPHEPNDTEEIAKYAALAQSGDGTVWKISLSGKDVAKAHKFLSRYISNLQKKQQDEQSSRSPVAGSLAIGEARAIDPNQWVDEVIFPRALGERVRKWLPFLKERFRNVSVNIAPSESKSKEIARLLFEGTSLADKNIIRTHFREALQRICNQELPSNDNIPMVSLNSIGGNAERQPRDFGFFGGSLTKDQFESLIRNGSKLLGRDGVASSRPSADPIGTTTRSKNSHTSFASLDLNQSPFFKTFESLYGPVWVQSEDDMGRIDSNHRLVGDARSTDQRKVYFGCNPNDLERKWEIVYERALEVVRGVRFLFLGSDQVFLQFMVQGNFFDYIEKTTGSHVSVDTSTGNHIRIDGKTNKPQLEGLLPADVRAMSEVKRADLAEELVRLQIEVFRDHFTRKHNWMFGRDWTTITLVGEEQLPDTSKKFGRLDSRSAPDSCMEMPEIVAHLDLPGTVAAHAATILYRFVSVDHDTQIRPRDAVLACIFIANKAQKRTKWRKLEAVLEAGYKVFYPDSPFKVESKDIASLEKRVLDAEGELLNSLQYDVFVRDLDTLEQAVEKMDLRLIERILSFAFGAQTLSAGANVWLKFGINYIFAASAAVLKCNVEDIVSSLDLIPMKIVQTLKLIVQFSKWEIPGNTKAPLNDAVELDKSQLIEWIPLVEAICMELTNKGSTQLKDLTTARQRYIAIGKANSSSYIIRKVPVHLVKEHVMKQVDGIEAESGCTFFFSPSETSGTEDIIVEGPWRAVAVADYLLRSSTHLTCLPPAESIASGISSASTLQVKTNAGLVNARHIKTSGGWDGTIQPHGSRAHAEKHFGGRNCMAGKISVNTLRESGLRWWIPNAKGSSSSGSFTDMLSIRRGFGNELNELADMARRLAGSAAFPILSTFCQQHGNCGKGGEASVPIPVPPTSSDGPLYMAVSLLRWPLEKFCVKEEKRSTKLESRTIENGFSAVALQELQLLTILHNLIPSPHGHPNFILPVSIAIPGPEEEENSTTQTIKTDDEMFSFFKTNKENEKAATSERTVKSFPHLIFQPCPFAITRFITRRKGIGGLLEASPVVSAWFHDLLAALVHCHSNNIVLRNIQSDQIIVDHSGGAKLSCLYKAHVQSIEERRHPLNMMSIAKKEMKRTNNDDFNAISPCAAPEILLGSTKHTKESDVWAMGCMLAHILLGKDCFPGQDRQKLLFAMYKIVGTPAKGNFEEGARFPHYKKPPKKYCRGVETALKRMLKVNVGENYTKAIDLIAKMLHLDPSMRCTAEQALNHEFLSEHRDSITDPSYRNAYVAEWMRLKNQVMNGSTEPAVSTSNLQRALLLATANTGADSNDENQDGLYDFD